MRPFLLGMDEHDGTILSIPAMRWNIKKYFRPYKQTRGDLNVVVRLGPWKGIFNAGPRTVELFNLDEDAREQQDVASTHAALVDTVKIEARQWLDTCRARAEGREAVEAGVLDEAQRSRLRSLGYVD